MGDILEDRAKTATVEWRSQIERDLMGLETIRRSGGITVATKRDALGRPIEQVIDGALRRTRTTKWGIGNRILSTTDSLTGNYTYSHDSFGRLTHSKCSNFDEIFRVPDAIGNFYKSVDKQDRTYNKSGRVTEVRRTDGVVNYEYDPEGNLIKKSEPNGSVWTYVWNGSGQLVSVERPDKKQVSFTYDVLGRRLSKKTENREVSWVWDGDVPIHELVKNGDEITWLFEDGGFSPVAKLVGENRFDIVTDHLETPIAMYDSRGMAVWNQSLTIWGERNATGAFGSPELCPFRYAGQYEDDETGLYYNRFRYFDPELGQYTSVDPIGLIGENPTLFGYVNDPLSEYDPFGLACSKKQTRSKKSNKRMRKNFEKSGGAKEKYLKKMAKTDKAKEIFSEEDIKKMEKGLVPEGYAVHHKKPLFRGGNNSQKNLVLINQKTHTANSRELHYYDGDVNPIDGGTFTKFITF